MKIRKIYKTNISQGEKTELSLLEKIILVFIPKHKKILIDTDSQNRELYSFEYKTLKGITFITKIKQGI